MNEFGSYVIDIPAVTADLTGIGIMLVVMWLALLVALAVNEPEPYRPD